MTLEEARAEFPVLAILAAVTPRTKLLALSHVLWTTGRRLDLAALKAETGLPLLVDGAQSAGAIPTGAGAYDLRKESAPPRDEAAGKAPASRHHARGRGR